MCRNAGVDVGVLRLARRTAARAERDRRDAQLPDLVGRLFDPARLDHTWVGDVTFVPTDEGWLYLATVLDLGSRRLIGYAMSDAADTDHVINAVAMAVAARGRTTMGGDTIFHSDRGSTHAGPLPPDVRRPGSRRASSRR